MSQELAKQGIKLLRTAFPVTLAVLTSIVVGSVKAGTIAFQYSMDGEISSEDKTRIRRAAGDPIIAAIMKAPWVKEKKR